MHHSADADCSEAFDLNVVEFANIVAEIGIAILQAIVYGRCAVSPESVDKLVFPSMATLSDGLVVGTDQNGLNSG